MSLQKMISQRYASIVARAHQRKPYSVRMSRPQGKRFLFLEVFDGSEATRDLIFRVMTFLCLDFGSPGLSADADSFVICARTAHAWLYTRFDQALRDLT